MVNLNIKKVYFTTPINSNKLYERENISGVRKEQMKINLQQHKHSVSVCQTKKV